MKSKRRLTAGRSDRVLLDPDDQSREAAACDPTAIKGGCPLDRIGEIFWRRDWARFAAIYCDLLRVSSGMPEGGAGAVGGVGGRTNAE